MNNSNDRTSPGVRSLRSNDNDQAMKVSNFVKIWKDEDKKPNQTHFSKEFDLGGIEDDLINYVEQRKNESNSFENLSPFKSKRKYPPIDDYM